MEKAKKAAAVTLGVVAGIAVYAAVISAQVIALEIPVDNAIASTGIGFFFGMAIERWSKS